MSFRFEDLLVWQRALDLCDQIDMLTRGFPKNEMYVLTPQIKRAADSVPLNIVEGSTGQSNPEFNKFLGYALRSDVEVVGCLYLAQKRNLIEQQTFSRIYGKCEEILVMLNALRNALKKN